MCMDILILMVIMLAIRMSTLLRDMIIHIHILLKISRLDYLFRIIGIFVFLLVEKVVRYVEERSGGVDSWGTIRPPVVV
ncbi:hypothetical protein Hanom_Chr16g01507551 [Helianthus anomalus]